MAGRKIKDIFIKISSDFDDKGFEKVSASLNKTAKIAAIGLGAVTGALGLAVKAAGDFQEQMSLVATMLGDQSEKYMPGFESALKKLSTTYGQSTATLSDGLYDILSASIPAEKAMGFLETSVRAAEAGFVDASLTADALTTVINAYGLSAEQAGDVSDWFFSVVEKGKTTMAELAPTIGLVLPLSKKLGVSLEEVGASLTVMTRGGIETNMAVTSLRAIMGAFLKPTKDLAKLTKDWGFESSQAAMQQLGMAEILERLSKVEDARLPRLIEEKTALTGLLTILDKRNEFMQDSISISERSGKTDEMLAKRTDNLNVQMRKLRETFKNIMVEVGTILIPVVKEMAEKISSNIDKVKDFIKGNEKLILTVSVLVPALLGIVVVVTKITAAVIKAIPIIKLMAKAMMKMQLTTVGAIGIISVAIVGLISKYKEWKKAVDEATEAQKRNSEMTGVLISKAAEWEGTLKELFLVRAKLFEQGLRETDQAVIDIDRRIAKLKELKKAGEGAGEKLPADPDIVEDNAKKIVSEFNSVGQFGEGVFTSLFTTIGKKTEEGEDKFKTFIGGVKKAFLDLVATMAGKAAIFGLLSLVTGGAFGAGTTLLKFMGLASAAEGGVFDKPTPVIVGDRPDKEPEIVGTAGQLAGMGGTQIIIQGDVNGDNAQGIINQIKEAVREGRGDGLAKQIVETGTELEDEAV